MTKKPLNCNNQKYTKWIYLLLTAGAFALAYLTLHDLQTAEGAGLYLSLKYGQSDRKGFDILVDIVGMLLLFAALFLPCLALKRLQSDSFFRITCVYLAFMPIMRPGVTVHLVDNLLNLKLRPSLPENNLTQLLLEGFADTVIVLRTELPLFLLLLMMTHSHGLSNLQKWQKIVIFSTFCLCIINFLFPAIAQETAYFMHYGLIIWCFSEWEKICERFPKFASWGNILFGGCYLRGIYRMIELMSTSHL